MFFSLNTSAINPEARQNFVHGGLHENIPHSMKKAKIEVPLPNIVW
jgi:hypothetical protein